MKEAGFQATSSLTSSPRLDYEAHQKIRDGTVGPRSIVVWRARRNTGIPGGAHQFYTGTERDKDSPGIPTIANGMDVQAIGGMLMTMMQERIAAGAFGSQSLGFDEDEMKRRLAKLPSEPDENLR